jgi:Secretion system C-terminal sorting domain
MTKICTLMVLLALLCLPCSRAFSQSSAGSLPIVLVVFDAAVTPAREVQLRWTVQQQFVTDFFNVERSNDGLNWQSIAAIPSSGVSSTPVSYSSTDKMPLNGINYYRIRIRSHDGSSGHTIVKAIQVDIIRSPRLYPNPASDMLHVGLIKPPGNAYWILNIINPAGQSILQKKYSSYFTAANISVGAFPNGLYHVEITDGSNRQVNTLLINHH